MTKQILNWFLASMKKSILISQLCIFALIPVILRYRILRGRNSVYMHFSSTAIWKLRIPSRAPKEQSNLQNTKILVLAINFHLGSA